MYSLVIWVGPSVQVDGCGKTLYDQFVLPVMKVTDYRTAVSGIRPSDLRKGGSAIPAFGRHGGSGTSGKCRVR